MINKAPAFQFYPQDYLACDKVAEMTLEEEGAYIRLLCYCWSAGSIPADPERCARLIGKGCSVETARFVQRSFNVCSTDVQRLVHKRLEKEREKQRLFREKASAAGKKSGKARAAKSIQEQSSNGRSTNVQLKPNSSSSSSDEDVLKLFDEFWKCYPRHTGKGGARKAFKGALKKMDAQKIIEAAKQFSSTNKSDPEFTPHPATWLNQERWTDEPLEPRKKKYQPFAWQEEQERRLRDGEITQAQFNAIILAKMHERD